VPEIPRQPSMQGPGGVQFIHHLHARSRPHRLVVGEGPHRLTGTRDFDQVRRPAELTVPKPVGHDGVAARQTVESDHELERDAREFVAVHLSHGPTSCITSNTREPPEPSSHAMSALTDAMAAGGAEAMRVFTAIMEMGTNDIAKIEAVRRG
jgi:hypothetical protein